MNGIAENPTWEQLTKEQKENWQKQAVLAFGTGDLTTAKFYFERMNQLNQKFSNMTEEELDAYEKVEAERYNNFVSWDNLKEIQKRFWSSVAIEALGMEIDLAETKSFYVKFNRNNLKYNVLSPEEIKKYEQDYIKANSPRLNLVAGRFPLCACKGCPNKAQMKVKDKNLVFSLCDSHAEESDYELMGRVK
jgi:hypothetical protein